MKHVRPPFSQHAFTLTELLIAMALSVSLVAGALHMFNGTLRSYRSLQAIAELDDRATFALRALAADVQLAGYAGAPTDAPPSRPATVRCYGRDASAWAFSPGAIELHMSGGGLPCPALGMPANDSDTLVIRHVDPMSVDPQVQAHAWYVDTDSSESALPSLRRQTLMPDGRIHNQEIMPGVESLNVSLGIDDDADARIDTFSHTTAPAGRIMAVRIQVVVRSHVHDTTIGGDGFQRLAAQRLIFLRNSSNG